VNPALLFLIRRSFTNAIRAKLKRLKNPRYLVPSLVGVGYYLLFFGPLPIFGRDRYDASPGNVPVDWRALGEWIGAAFFLFFVVIAWVLPARGSPLAFLECEVALLFPAPLTRKDLVRYKLLDLQRYLFIGPLIIVLLNMGRLGVMRALFMFLGAWMAFSVLALHGIGAKMTRLSLAEHGASGWRRQALPLLVLLAFFGVVIGTAPAFPTLSMADHPLEQVKTWLDALGESPAGKALLPFRLLARPAIAADPAAFLLRAGILACMAFILYVWVLSNDTAFEEAAAAQAEVLSRRIEAARKGRFTTGVTGKAPRRNPWRLGLDGSPEIAFAWKSVTEALRSYSPRLIIFLVTAVFVALPFSIKAASEKGDAGAKILVAAAGGMAGCALLLVFAGPTLLGVNLRQDLERIEVLKTLPLTGARLVRSSLVGTLLPVAAVQALLVVLAVILFPSQDKWPEITPAWRVAAAMIGMIVFPCLTALSASVDAAGALFFPAWVKPGQQPVQGGMEGIGYGIVTALAKALVFGFGALIPLGLGFGIVFLGVRIGGPLFGPAASILGALFAGSVILVEAWVACRILGARFERLDPAEEGMIS
jgi:hypothetical protein